MSRIVPSPLRGDRQLVSVAPLRKLRDEWAAEIDKRAFRNPGSSELAVLRSCLLEVDAALEAALEADAWGGVKEAHAATGVSPATIKRWCEEHGEKIGAFRPDGQKAWLIDLRRFEAFAKVNKSQWERRAAKDRKEARDGPPRESGVFQSPASNPTRPSRPSRAA